MSKADNSPNAETNGPGDAMSATGMFQGTFRTEPDPFEKPAAFAEEAPAPPRQAAPHSYPARTASAEPPSFPGGEFTQLFGSRSSQKPVVPQVAPFEPASEATRMFPAPATVPKVKGYSSPGGSDSASGEGSFTQLFRGPAAEASEPTGVPQTNKSAQALEKRDWAVNFEPETNRKPVPESPGVTEIFRALSTNEKPSAEKPISFSPVRPAVAPTTIPSESFTAILQKLTEAAPVAHSPVAHGVDTLQIATPASAPATGQGEYTRIIAAEGTKPVGSVAAPQEAAETRVFPVKLDAPVPAVPRFSAPQLAPPVAPPKTKLQEMVPILLLLNALLMFVLIVLAIFMLLRK